VRRLAANHGYVSGVSHHRRVGVSLRATRPDPIGPRAPVHVEQPAAAKTPQAGGGASPAAGTGGDAPRTDLQGPPADAPSLLVGGGGSPRAGGDAAPAAGVGGDKPGRDGPAPPAAAQSPLAGGGASPAAGTGGDAPRKHVQVTGARLFGAAGLRISLVRARHCGGSRPCEFWVPNDAKTILVCGATAAADTPRGGCSLLRCYHHPPSPAPPVRS